MNYDASNPESLSETPERLSEPKTRSGSPAAAAKKRATEVLTPSQIRAAKLHDCGETVQFARASLGSDVGDHDVHYQNFVLVKGLSRNHGHGRLYYKYPL